LSRRVLIAVPSAGSIEPETFVSIYNMEVPEGVETELKIFYSYLVDEARNKISDYAVEKGFESVLFVDSDMRLPRDTLSRLLSAGKDIVSALYVKKKEGEKTIELFLKNENFRADNMIIRNVRESEVQDAGLMEIDACGFGCVLVRTSVFPRIGYPYFRFTLIDREKRIGEDIDFCIKAKNNRLSIYALADLRVGHIGKKEYLL
jgi:GT2 family glycosyltransferase